MSLDRRQIEAIAAEAGNAFYLLDVRRFTRNCRAFADAFRAIYPATRLAYSYKTNYTPRLGRVVLELGGYAEVVSPLEYELARRIGVPADRIVFNGPYKPPREFRRALDEGATVNLDSVAEIELLEQRSGRPCRVGLRCSFDVGSGESSRFGFDADGDALRLAVERIRKIAGVELAGLHCHFCTPTKSVELYSRIATRMLALADELFPARPPRFLNFGGGFFSPMPEDLRKQFGCDVPSFGDYADAVATRFTEHYGASARTELVLEPGVAIVADAMQFVAEVVERRRLASREVAVVAGSIYNIKPTKSTKNLPLRVVRGTRRPDATREPIDIVGHTCMEDDCLYMGYRGPLAPGDFVVFDNVGAYTIVLKPPFIFPCPPVIEIDAAAGTWRTVKRQEDFADLFATFDLGDPDSADPTR